MTFQTIYGIFETQTVKPFVVYKMTFKRHSQSSEMSTFNRSTRSLCQRPEK